MKNPEQPGWPLIGLEESTRTLSMMIKSGRMPHALLFSGPSGCGKNTLARALAAALNCAAPAPDGSPCGQCPSCGKIRRDSHPDLKTIGPSGKSNQIKMDDVQVLRAEMGFRPYEGRIKVFIIREADRLGSESGNALLKTLEEPPPDSMLILTSASEAKVMSTILSRCMRLRLPPLPQSLILQTLKEQRGLNDLEARLLAALSAGALGPALNLDQDWCRRQWDSLNLILSPASAPKAMEAAWSWVKEQAADEEHLPGEVLAIMHLWWRETFRLKASGQPALEGPPASAAQSAWAEAASPLVIKQVIFALEKLEDSLSRFVKAELAYENYWLAVLKLSPFT